MRVKTTTIWLFFPYFFSRPSAIVSFRLTLVYIIINPLHILARSAVCPQMSCTSSLSNNDIQTPDQVSVPHTTPYFHWDTLTPLSSSRSPLLERGGPSIRMRPAMHLYYFYFFFIIIFLNIFAKYIGKGCMCIATGANNKT